MQIAELFLDCVRAVHLFSLALGLGLAVFMDMRTVSRMTKPFQQRDLNLVHSVHTAIAVALLGLWGSGLCLLYIRTGFVLDQFSPKLFVKLGVVILLTLNAMLIGRYVIPVLVDAIGRPLSALPLRARIPMTIVASNSAFCWAAGLLLGTSSVLKTAPWALLLPFFAAMYFAFLGVSMLVAMVMRGDSGPVPHQPGPLQLHAFAKI